MRKALILAVVACIVLGVMVLAGCAQKGAPAPTTAPLPTTPVATTPKPTPSPTATATPTPTASPTATPTPQKDYGGILTIINKNPPSTFGYPHKSPSFGDLMALQPCLESLIDFTRDGKTIRPKLATGWQIADDKLSITFTLRRGVKFHDGTDFNAEAVKWNLEENMKNNPGATRNWQSVEVIDPYTIRVNFKTFQNTDISNLDGITIISPTAVAKNGVEWAKTNPVGTGPFKFKSFQRDVSLEYVRFDDYWGGKPYLDGIKYSYIADQTVALMAMQAGEALVIEEAVAKVAYELKNKGFNIIDRRGPGMHLWPDSANPDSVLANQKVREAVEYAIDRAAIAKNFGYGFWEPLYQPNVPEQYGHIPDLVGRQYNPDKAKQLLAEAGYPKGFTINIISASNFSLDPLVSIQGYLQAVGIIATLEVVTPAKWTEYRTKGWTGFIYCTQGAEDYNYSAYLQRYYLTTALNYPSTLKTAELDQIIQDSLATSDIPTQIKLCQQAVRYIYEHAMQIPLWVESASYVLNPSVRDTGYATHGVGFRWSPAETWISKKK